MAVFALPGIAQDDPTVDDVVALVMTVPEIADGLEALSFYDTLPVGASADVWTVRFIAGGEMLVTAEIDIAAGIILSYQIA